MLLIKTAPEANGAHASQRMDGAALPTSGWAVIPAELESAAVSLLPWVLLTVSDGIVTAIEDNTAVRAEWEVAQTEVKEPINDLTQLQLALAELAELIAGGAA